MDSYSHSARNTFSAAPIDRLTHYRKNPDWLAARLTDERTRIVPVWRTRNLLVDANPPQAVFLSPQQMGDLLRPDELIFLGEIDETPDGLIESTLFFAQEVESEPAAPDEPPAALQEHGRFDDLRRMGLNLEAGVPHDEGAILIFARAMTYWHSRHRFCGDCGSRTHIQEGGWVRRCSTCEKMIFPRTDPAIIVAVTHGESILLGRQATWPPRYYSVVAGFVEPGESVEDAVKREVMEETGLQVGAVHYHSSQPWPFPSSLMLGYMAEAEDTNIKLIDQELENAIWRTRAELKENVESGTLRLSPNISISYRLIESWFDAGDFGPLANVTPGESRH